jgi:hypothetical protein
MNNEDNHISMNADTNETIDMSPQPACDALLALRPVAPAEVWA